MIACAKGGAPMQFMSPTGLGYEKTLGGSGGNTFYSGMSLSLN